MSTPLNVEAAILRLQQANLPHLNRPLTNIIDVRIDGRGRIVIETVESDEIASLRSEVKSLEDDLRVELEDLRSAERRAERAEEALRILQEKLRELGR